jgi:hypothetical protein
VRELAAAWRRDPGLGIEGIHIFTCGGVLPGAAGANALLAAAPARVTQNIAKCAPAGCAAVRLCSRTPEAGGRFRFEGALLPT